MNEWIDITRPVDEDMVMWPGRQPPRRIWAKRLADGDHCNATSWEMSAHTGTHLDAPLHFVEGGESIDRIRPDTLIGDCQVLEGDGSGKRILEPADVREGYGQSRILIRSGHSYPSESRTYRDHTEMMSAEAASYLLAGGLRLLGTDRLSVDDSNGGSFSLHRHLLAAGCVILEGIDLVAVAPGTYTICVLPLRLAGAEASPARALLSRRPQNLG
ncbi:MAG: cyclase family protein [Alphaproteobacteria bacterium]